MFRKVIFVIFASVLFLLPISSASASDAETQQIQKHLKSLNYNPGPVDGVMGKKTRSAIESFRNDWDMPSTATNAEILQKLSTLATEATPDAQTAAEIQKLLTEFGYLPGTIAGVWDEASKRSLWLYLGVENKRALLQEKGKTAAEQHRDVLVYMRKQKEQAQHSNDDRFFVPVALSAYLGNSVIDRSSKYMVTSSKSSFSTSDQPASFDLRVTDLESGQQFRALTAPPIATGTLGDSSWDITSDGRFVVFANYAIHVVEVATGRAVRTFWTRINTNGNAEQISKIVARPNSTEVIATVDNQVVIYDWATGRFVASLGKYGNVKFRKGNKIWSYRWEAANSLVISPDGRYLATAGTEFAIRIYDLERRKLAFKSNGKAGRNYDDLVFTSDGSTVFASGSSFDSNDYRSLHRLDLRDRKIRSVKFHNAYSIAPLSNGSVKVTGKRNAGDNLDAWTNYDISSSGQVVVSADQSSTLLSPDGRFAIRSLSQEQAKQNSIGEGFVIRDLVQEREKIFFARGAASSYLYRVSTDPADEPFARKVRKFDVQSGKIIEGATLSQATGRPSGVAGKIVDVGDGKYYVLLGGPSLLYADNPNPDGPDLGDVRVFDTTNGTRVCASRERSPWHGRDTWDDPNGTKPERMNGHSIAWSSELQLGFVWTQSGIAVVDKNCATLRRINVAKATNYRWRPSSKISKKAKTKNSEGIALSGTGQRLLVWRAEQAVQAIDPRTGEQLRVYRTDLDIAKPANMSQSDLQFLAKRPQHLLVERVLSVPGSEKFIVFANGGGYVDDTNSVGVVQVFDENEESWQSAYLEQLFRDWAVSRNGRFLAILAFGGTVKVVDPSNGRPIASLPTDQIYERISFSEDGRRLFAYAADGSMRTIDPSTGELLTSTLMFEDGEWITLTPEGFFIASDNGALDLKVRVEDLKLVPIGNAYNALYRPDLVQAKLAGDPDGKVREAASRLDLQTVIESGFPPRLNLVSPEAKTTITGDGSGSFSVAVEIEIKATTGGIGKLEWSVNGVLQDLSKRALSPLVLADGVEAAEPAGETKRVTQNLYLAPGENEIRVVAYNAAGLIASDPLTVSVTLDEPEITDPKLYVLSVGVNDYFDSRLDLAYASSDAEAIGTALKVAGKELYSDVIVETVLDKDVTVDGLNAAFGRLESKVRPGDVFVFFLAGHGKTEDGRYYFLPHDFRYTDEDSFKTAGIGQATLQEWFSRIRAQKSVLLFDTCESGTLTAEPVVRGTEALAAINRLNRAIGRTTLTASTDTAPALEGFRGHGVFTYTLLDAIASADNDNDRAVDVTELASYIDRRLPEYSEAAFGYTQVPQMKVVGNSFPIAKATVVLSDEPTELIPKDPTHVVIQPADVLAEAIEGGALITKLQPGTSVRLLSTDNGWVLIAKDGAEIGYLSEGSLVSLK